MEAEEKKVELENVKIKKETEKKAVEEEKKDEETKNKEEKEEKLRQEGFQKSMEDAFVKGEKGAAEPKIEDLHLDAASNTINFSSMTPEEAAAPLNMMNAEPTTLQIDSTQVEQTPTSLDVSPLDAPPLSSFLETQRYLRNKLIK